MLAAGTGADGYRVLARKYRPTTFAELIGQEAMVRTLTNALASGRLAHAFMLSGVRGIGKTTTARIVARALNCVGADGTGGPTAAPCGQCAHCVAITADRHMDVIEMDAASRTGVDEIRELLDGTRYRPTSARYKIYIIDEVHMLSRNAFNALLKTLEEPPEHVRFVFATTEIRKVPVTVLSRCQRFDLRRIDADLLVAHLGDIARREGADASATALHLIARAADGSVRDGLSLLDQAIAHGEGTVEEDDVRRMLGLADRSVTFDLLDAAIRGDAAAALDLLAAQYRAGADPVEILTDLLDLTHWLTRIKVVPNCVDAAGVPEAERVRGRSMAERLAMGEASRLWQMLLKGLGETRAAPSPVQAAEMVLIRIAYAARLPTPAEALRQAQDRSAGSSGSRTDLGGQADRAVAPGPAGSGAREGQASTTRAPSARSASPPAQGTSAMAVAPVAAVPNLAPATERDPDDGGAAAPSAGAAPTNFAAVVALAREEREAILYGQLIADVHLVRFEPGRIEIRPAGAAPADLVRRLREFLTRQTGRSWLVAVSREEGEPTILEQRQKQDADRRRRVEAEPLVQAVLAAFPGSRLGEVRAVGAAEAIADPDAPLEDNPVEDDAEAGSDGGRESAGAGD
ncbi:MAG: DNA polymerase III subunit gamma/tau [Rhodospirillales bacterium]|nr:DNA polymerase III subunit gamma/tau [Rhodospirillales bacterium]